MLFTSSLGGYLFDKYNFLGKNLFFILILANLMVPFEVLLVPLFRISHSFGLVGNYGGLIIPFLVSPFGLYLMKQFCHEVPNDLIEAARIDGSSEFGTFFRIMLPLMKPALSALSISLLWATGAATLASGGDQLDAHGTLPGLRRAIRLWHGTV